LTSGGGQRTARPTADVPMLSSTAINDEIEKQKAEITKSKAEILKR
jgi:hypothetical protein